MNFACCYLDFNQVRYLVPWDPQAHSCALTMLEMRNLGLYNAGLQCHDQLLYCVNTCCNKTNNYDSLFALSPYVQSQKLG